jgi:hypothetical protein
MEGTRMNRDQFHENKREKGGNLKVAQGILLGVAAFMLMAAATNRIANPFWEGSWQNGANAGNQSLTNLSLIQSTNYSGITATSMSAWVETRLVYVDGTTGTDTRTALSAYSRTKPFATIAAAITAATSGDKIIINPGNYNEQLTLKNGVNLHFEEGATMIRTQTADGQILMKDNAVAVTCSITGRGVFSITGGSNGRILSLQAASNVTWEFKSATNSTAGFNFISLQDTASSNLIMRGDSVTTSSGPYGIYTAQSSTLVATLQNLTGLEPVQTTATSKAWFFLQNGLCNGSVGNSLF